MGAELPIKRAVVLAGIDYSTYRQWLKKGLDSNYPVHASFRRRVNKIQTEIELKKLRIIHKAAEGYLLRDKKVKINKRGKTKTITIKQIPPDFKAACWFLERRFPERYGKSSLQQRPVSDSYTIAAQVKSKFDALVESVPVSP